MACETYIVILRHAESIPRIHYDTNSELCNNGTIRNNLSRNSGRILMKILLSVEIFVGVKLLHAFDCSSNRKNFFYIHNNCELSRGVTMLMHNDKVHTDVKIALHFFIRRILYALARCGETLW